MGIFPQVRDILPQLRDGMSFPLIEFKTSMRVARPLPWVYLDSIQEMEAPVLRHPTF
jgi:hypothetical protein